MSDEARTYALLISQEFPAPPAFTLEAMRERSENVHAKVNQRFLGNFTGSEEERTVKVDENTGNIIVPKIKSITKVSIEINRNTNYNLYTSRC